MTAALSKAEASLAALDALRERIAKLEGGSIDLAIAKYDDIARRIADERASLDDIGRHFGAAHAEIERRLRRLEDGN